MLMPLSHTHLNRDAFTLILSSNYIANALGLLEDSTLRGNRLSGLRVSHSPPGFSRRGLWLLRNRGAMQNEEGENIDLYIPRKCSSTNRLITSKDHASVQLNVGHVDANGIYTGQFTTFAFCGAVRAQGDVDSALDRLWLKKKAELGQ